jgi:hypothetical protein
VDSYKQKLNKNLIVFTSDQIKLAIVQCCFLETFATAALGIPLTIQIGTACKH